MEKSKDQRTRVFKTELIYVTLKRPKRGKFLRSYLDWMVTRFANKEQQEDPKQLLIEVLSDVKSGTYSAKTVKRLGMGKKEIPFEFQIRQFSQAGLPSDQPEVIIISGNGNPTTFIEWLTSKGYQVELKTIKHQEFRSL